MCKAVLISIHPQWCELIASGEKTVEVRKTRPKLGHPFKVYIYQTKTVYVSKSHKNDVLVPIQWNTGKVIGEFACNDIIYIGNISTDPWSHLLGEVHERYKRLVTQKACLTERELHEYGGQYLWHISDLVIYDKPKEITQFLKPCECDFNIEKCIGCKNLDYNDLGVACCDRRIIRPPQSWCYVEEV